MERCKHTFFIKNEKIAECVFCDFQKEPTVQEIEVWHAKMKKVDNAMSGSNPSVVRMSSLRGITPKGSRIL